MANDKTLSAGLPNLSFVRTFVTLADAGSFSAAAAQLGLAQPTVSQQIQKLEQQLGAVLISRSHAHCTPTPDGDRLLAPARSLLAAAERLQASAEGDRVLIGCSGNIAAYFIAEDLKRFVDTVSEPVKWDMAIASNPEVAERMAVGEIDVAVMEWPLRHPALITRAWRREPLAVIVAGDHPWARRGEIGLEDLLYLDFIGGEPGSGTGTLLTEAFGSEAEKLKITHNLNSTEAVKSAVIAGLGSSIVFRRAVRDEIDAGYLAALDVRGVALEKTLHVSLRSGTPEGALAARLAAFLADEKTQQAA